MMQEIQKWVKMNHALITSTYEQLHQLAEVSWQEIRTTAYICKQLEEMGIAYRTFPDQTGIVADWNTEEGTTGTVIALRSDMDALSHRTHDGVQTIHTCGHDAHMTMTLNTLRCLKTCGFQPKGTFRLLFQPAEEVGAGAKSFIHKGVMDDVDYLLGIHLRPIQELPFGKAAAAIYHGASVQAEGTIEGIQAHAARPHLGVNVIDSLAAIIHAVNAIKADPAIPQSVKVTKVFAGDAINTIPGHATFALDLRSQTNENMEKLIARAESAIRSAGSANGAKLDFRIVSYMKAASSNPFMEDIIGRVIRQTLGNENFCPPIHTSGGEDFHEYTYENKRIQATMIGLGADLKPGLHHPGMTFNQAALPIGVALLANAIVSLFDAEQRKASVLDKAYKEVKSIGT